MNAKPHSWEQQFNVRPFEHRLKTILRFNKLLSCGLEEKLTDCLYDFTSDEPLTVKAIDFYGERIIEIPVIGVAEDKWHTKDELRRIVRRSIGGPRTYAEVDRRLRALLHRELFREKKWQENVDELIAYALGGRITASTVRKRRQDRPRRG